MTTKNSMVLFRVNLSADYKEILLQYLSNLKLVHIKSKSEIGEKIEKENILSIKIKKLRQNMESLFKDLKITESDFQKLKFKDNDKIKFDVKDIDDLLDQILNEIYFFANRINELKKYISTIEIELERINIIHGTYIFLERYSLTRDNLLKFKRLNFKVFTTFAKNLENIENLLEFSHFPNFLQYDYLNNERIVFFVIYPMDQEETLKERMRITHAEEVPVLKRYVGLDGIRFARIANEIKYIVNSLTKYQKELERLRDDNLLLFAAMHEIVENMEEHIWVSNQFEELALNRLELSFYVPFGKKREVQKNLLEEFEDNIYLELIDIVKNRFITLKEEKTHLHAGKSPDSKKIQVIEEESSKEEGVEKDLRNDAPTIMKNNFFVRPFETITRMYGTPSYSEIDPTPLLAFTFPILFGIMFGDIGHGLVLMISGLLGALIFRKKKGIDFFNFCWIIFYCGIGAVLMGFLYGEFFGIHDIEVFGTVLIHLEPVTIPVLNITLHNPLNNIMTIFKFAVLIGVIHINLGWFIQFLNYWKQSRKFLAITDSFIKILILTGGTILIFGFGFNIDNWLTPPYPILLPLIPGILLIVLKPFGKIFRITYLKEETVGGLLGEGSMESFETVLSIVSNVASYIRLLALALAHISLMVAIQAMANLIQGEGIVNVIIRIVGLVFGNMIVILLEGLLVFLNTIRLHFYEFFFKFYQGSGIEFIPFILDDNYSTIIFRLELKKDVISEEIEKELDIKIIKKDIDEAIDLISKKYT